MINQHSRDLIILVVGKAFQVLIGLVALRLLTELLSEAQVGIYYMLLTVVSLLAFVFFNPLGQFFGRHLVHWQQNDNLKTATVVLLLLRGVAFPFAVLCSLFLFYFFDFQLHLSLFEYTIFIVASLIALTHGVFLSAINILISRIAFIAYAILILGTGLLLSIVFVQFTETAIAWLYGGIIVQVVFSLFLYKLVVKKNQFSSVKFKYVFSMGYIKTVFFFILPVTVTLLLQWGQTTSFRLVVGDLYSLQVLSFIAVGMALSGALFSALESLLTQFYMPLYLKEITNASYQGRARAWNNLARIIFPIYISTAVYVIALAPYLAKVLVAEKFYEAYIYTMIGAIVELFRVVTNMFYLVSQSEIDTKKTIVPYFFGFSIMIFGLYTIDVSDSLWKIPVILAFSYLVTLVIMILNMKKMLPIKIEGWMLLKSLLIMLPLLIVFFLAPEVTLLNAVMILLLGGVYFLMVLYFLLRNKVAILGLE